MAYCTNPSPTPRDASSRHLADREPDFGKAITLFGNDAALADLTAEQRDVLRRAGDLAAKHAIDAAPDEQDLATGYCTGARVMLAAEGDLAAMRRAAAPV